VPFKNEKSFIVHDFSEKIKAGWLPEAAMSACGRPTLPTQRHDRRVDSAPKSRQFALIETLVRRLGFAFSWSWLLEPRAARLLTVEDDRTLDVHIGRLRVELGAAGNIRTVRGIRYADSPKN
jgi:DNA-binding response OmpR family regulator